VAITRIMRVTKRFGQAVSALSSERAPGERTQLGQALPSRLEPRRVLGSGTHVNVLLRGRPGAKLQLCFRYVSDARQAPRKLLSRSAAGQPLGTARADGGLGKCPREIALAELLPLCEKS